MDKLKSLTHRSRGKAPSREQTPPLPAPSSAVQDPIKTAQPSSYGFRVWHDPSNTVNAKSHLFDLIFVHGLTGDRELTWTHPKSKEPWPKTLIPRGFPGARILTYGYDAYVVLKTGPVSSNRLSSHSLDFLNATVAIRQTRGSEPRPLIFVAHSLGGIVCKDALLLSSRSDDDTEKAVFNDTLGIVFMGTPHTGAGLAWWGKVPATALGFIKSTNKSLLDVLETNNEIITRIQDEFARKIRSTANTENEIHVVCFYETMPTFHMQQIVSIESAVLPGYNHISVRADHKNMVKFLSEEEDEGCAHLFGILRRWNRLAEERVASTGLSVDMIKRYKSECFNSLAFPEMLYRRSDISGPIEDTCNWILDDESYARWSTRLDREAEGQYPQVSTPIVRDGSTTDFLFVCGKPGSGKSTLMKNLFAVHTERQKASNGVCLSFFFNARGSVLEKSSSGLYRSLLFQLLHLRPTLFPTILPFLREKKAITGSRELDWHHSEIAELFHRILRDERTRDVTIFIDGMDECEDSDVGRDIVTSLEHSLQVSLKQSTNLRVCLSSRPYRQIRPKFALELQVEAQNSSDIALYVDRELVLHQFGNLEDIKNMLISKASGVFLWIALVVKRLRTAWDGGCMPSQIRSIVRELPPKLQDLYVHVTRSMTQEQLESSFKIAQLVLSTDTPLTPNDLDAILTLTSGPMGSPRSSLMEIAKTSPVNAPNLRRFRAFLTETTGGLFEISTSSSAPIVQAIHETVREFLRSTEAQELYGSKSSSLKTGKARDMINLAILNYGLSVEARAVFDRADNGDEYTPSWVWSCQQSPPQEQHCVSQAVPEYLLFHGLEHIKASYQKWTEASDERKFALRQQMEGWLFIYIMMENWNAANQEYSDVETRPNDFDDYVKPQTPRSDFIVAQRFLSFLQEYRHQLALTEREVKQMAMCMNNRSALFEIIEAISRQSGKIRQQHLYKYHLSCWAMCEEGVSVVGAVKVLDRKRRREITQDEEAVEPSDVTQIFCENARGVAFTARFSWAADSIEQTGLPDVWILEEDLDKFLRLCHWKLAEVEDGPVPAALDAENGHIALILAEELVVPPERERPHKQPRVFAVYEQGSSNVWAPKYGTHKGKSFNARPPRQRPHSKLSVSSLRTNAPDRRLGSSIWFAWENVGIEPKIEGTRDETGDVHVGKRLEVGNVPGLSADALEELESSQLDKEISVPGYPVAERLLGPWTQWQP